MSSLGEDSDSSKLTVNSEHEFEREFILDDFNKILEDSSTEDDHKDILDWIKNENLCLYSKEKDTGDSLIKILLEEVGNGHEVVEKVMDGYISTTCTNPNSNAFSVNVDFTGLMSETELRGDKMDSGLQSLFRCQRKESGDSVLDDIVELKLKYQLNFWDPYTNRFKGKKENCSKSFLGLLAHPVLACFIALKWNKVWRYFLAHTILFLVFLASYYSYIIRIFMVDHSHHNQTAASSSGNKTTLPGFLEEFPAWWSCIELVFAICTTLLIGSELYQVYKSGWQNYLKDTENWIQIFIFGTAIFAMSSRQYILTLSEDGEYVRGVISLGIGATWLKFILVVGRYPFRGGDFSIMFYRVLRKLFKYVLALFMIVGGFSCSFIVISYGTERGGFDAPLKSFALTLTMAMGEFDSHGLYGEFEKKEYEDEKVSRTFAMILLVGVVLAGTITMVNLFITVIITSKEKLTQSVLEENLFYMAQCSEMIKDSALRTHKLINWGKNSSMNFKIEKRATFCVHKICGSKCSAEKVPYNIKAIEDKLRKLAAEKIEQAKKLTPKP